VKLSLLTVILLSLTGCSLWVPVEGKYVSAEHQFETELPAGWRRMFSTREGLTLTRDGLPLQTLRIVRNPFDQELSFTKRKLMKGMLNQEVSEIIIDNLRSNQNISNFQVVENRPIDLGGYSGFKIVYTYQAKDNLKKSGVYYGSLVNQWHYYLYFEAPSQYYFARHQPSFEQVKESFKITQ
jgi:hypothetical protein